MEDVNTLLGVWSALFAVATFISCRSCTGLFNIVHINLNKLPLFRKFYSFHNVFWGIFGAFLITHLSLAIHSVVTEASYEGDAAEGYMFIWTGAGIFVIALSLLLSCRVYPKIYRAVTGGHNPLNSKVFATFFKLHSYMWIVLILLVILHLTLGEGLD